ncbi:Fe-S-cluster containining protein [Deinobacterium chartae]|uniref:Fe-S-cluster containining protein n=1 Tax=Deinobacterium chartae TaxID=521158 RepID=A0A841HUX3_9DEIO|nr:YkgJ family cysteine cluster protein [Deinobacterium chartae]MBB6097271.1 Fe-S-cluster containining protein [Deinobacterium chartae]
MDRVNALTRYLEERGLGPLEAATRAAALNREYGLQLARLRQQLEEAAGEADLARVADALHGAYTEHAERPRAAWEAAPALACKAGCTPCCHLRVRTTPLEVFALAAAVRALPGGGRVRLERRLRAAARAAARLSHRQWNLQGPGCPLLEGGRCGLYAVRPLTCRAHHSLALRPCQQLHARGEAALPTDPERELTGLLFVGAVSEASAALGRQSDAVELTGALLAALENPELAERWQAGERVFKSADDLEAEATASRASRNR